MTACWQGPSAQEMRSSHGHIPAAVLLFLMVIRILTQSDFLFSDPGPQLSVHMTDRVPGRHRVLAEDLAHVIKKSGGTEQHAGFPLIFKMVQEELRVLVSLLR